MVRKPYVERGRLYLGSGKVQKGEFLSFLAAASRFVPILSLAGEILGKGRKKIYAEKEKYKE